MAKDRYRELHYSTAERLLHAEVWRSIPGFEHYEASNQGRIRSWWRRGKRGPLVMKLQVGSNGYMSCVLTGTDGRHANFSVHTLVLRTFTGPPGQGQETRHMNGDRFDNRLTNLNWGTHTENIADMRSHGTLPVGSRNGRSKLTNRQVIEMRRLRSQGQEYQEIAAAYGLTTSTAWSAITGASYPGLPLAQPHSRRGRKAA